MTGVGIIRILTGVAARAFREFADVGFELLDFGLFFRPVCVNALDIILSEKQSE